MKSGSEIQHFEDHKDDPDEWGDSVAIPPSQAAGRRRLASVVSVRFAPEELEVIRRASPDGNVSQFIRESTLRAATAASSLRQIFTVSARIHEGERSSVAVALPSKFGSATLPWSNPLTLNLSLVSSNS
jgi:hypothetical protein